MSFLSKVFHPDSRRGKDHRQFSPEPGKSPLECSRLEWWEFGAFCPLRDSKLESILGLGEPTTDQLLEGKTPPDSDSRNVGDSRPQQNPLWRNLVALGVVIVVLSPPLFLLVRTISAPLPDFPIADDPALIELYTLRASQGTQLQGPYSRFGFHHPGPALFYLLAPFYKFSAYATGSLNLGILSWNCVFLIIILLVPLKLGGTRGLMLASVPISLLVVYLRPFLFWGTWNPYASILPFAASVACCFAVALGRWGFLPIGSIAASIAIQCHLVLATPTVLIWVFALISATFVYRRQPDPRKLRLVLVATSLLLAVAWGPVVIEEFVNSPGNLTKLIDFVLHRDGDIQGLRALVPTLSSCSEVLFLPLGVGGQVRLPVEYRCWSACITVVFALLLSAMLVVSLVMRRKDALVVSSLSLVLLVGCILSTGSLSGQLYPYLTLWTVSVCPLLAAHTSAILCRIPEETRGSRLLNVGVAISVFVTIGISASGVMAFARNPQLSAWLNSGWGPAAYGRIWPSTNRALSESGVSAPRIRIENRKEWPLASTIFLQLAKRGSQVSVDPEWGFMFGDHSVNLADDGLLIVGNPKRTNYQKAIDAETAPIILVPLPRKLVSTLDLGSEEAEPFLRSGFYLHETADDGTGFRWSKGKSSSLCFRLEPDSPYVLEFECAPLPYIQNQGIEVWINGFLVETLELPSGWSTQSIQVGRDFISDINRLVFKYRSVGSPANLAGSPDSRSLAVKFKHLELRKVGL